MSKQKQLKASELIALLQELINKHGDLPVYADSDDEHGPVTANTVGFEVAHPRDNLQPDRFFIYGDYYSQFEDEE